MGEIKKHEEKIKTRSGNSTGIQTTVLLGSTIALRRDLVT